MITKKKRCNKVLNQLLGVLFLTINFCLASCNGQANKEELRTMNTSESVQKNSTIDKNNSLIQSTQNTNTQISQVVRMVFQDSRGNMWFGTQNGAFMQTGDSLIHFDGIRSEMGQAVTIKDIVEDRDGKIWFGHTDGVSCFDGEHVSNYYPSDGLIHYDVWNLEVLSNGQIWIGTAEGACVFDGQKFTNFELPEGVIDPTRGVSTTKMVHNILEDSKGNIWFSTNAGLFQWTHNTLSHASEEWGISTHFVNEVFEDSKGNLWISTKEALYKRTGDKLENITKDIVEIGKGIGCIAEDQYGTIWFTLNLHHLYTYKDGKVAEFQKSEDNKEPVVFQIFPDQKDRLWFVGFGGAFRLENGHFIPITKQGPW